VKQTWGKIKYAWFCWEKGYKGKTIREFITFDTKTMEELDASDATAHSTGSNEQSDDKGNRKGKSLSGLCNLLQADACGLTWGWAYDGKQEVAKCVLYIDFPNGQVSFHSTDRFAGPNYPGEWDEEHTSEERILSFCDGVMRPARRGRRQQTA
jgi:hypothetical protein